MPHCPFHLAPVCIEQALEVPSRDCRLSHLRFAYHSSRDTKVTRFTNIAVVVRPRRSTDSLKDEAADIRMITNQLAS
jgi:hypothetical protein